MRRLRILLSVSITTQPHFYINMSADLVTIGEGSQLTWHGHDSDMQFGFRLFLGDSLNGNYYKNQGALVPFTNEYIYATSLVGFVQLHRYFLLMN